MWVQNRNKAIWYTMLPDVSLDGSTATTGVASVSPSSTRNKGEQIKYFNYACLNVLAVETIPQLVTSVCISGAKLPFLFSA